MITSTWLGAATIAAMAALSSADTTLIYTMAGVESWQLQYEMVLDLSVASADIPLMSYSVVPLTAAIGLNQTEVTREVSLLVNVKMREGFAALGLTDHGTVDQHTGKPGRGHTHKL